MSGGGTQNSLRKALGAIKDTTTVSLAKVNSDYKVYRLHTMLLRALWTVDVSNYLGVAKNFAGIGHCYC